MQPKENGETFQSFVNERSNEAQLDELVQVHAGPAIGSGE